MADGKRMVKTYENIRIYQGNQIGGCVTVISSTVNGETHRIMIDYGSSLEGSATVKDFDYPWEEEPVDAVFFTHYHGDHVGRIGEIPKSVKKLYMGETARKVMINIQRTLTHIESEDAVKHEKELAILKDDERIKTFEKGEYFYKHIEDIPGFRIEPYSVDHSAYDAYMFLIEVEDDSIPGGKSVILHTGDFRGHGRRGKAMIPVINYYIRKYGNSKGIGEPKRNVDVLITEGTMIGQAGKKPLTEYELQLQATEYLHKHKYAFLICSSTNLDSLASFYQAAQNASVPYGRYLYTYNNYVKAQLETFTNTAGEYTDLYRFEHVHKIDLEKELKSEKWEEPRTQRELMRYTGFLAIIKPNDEGEKVIDAFVEDNKNGRIKDMPVIIYSLWDGYLNKDHPARKEDWIDFMEKQESKGVEVKHLHTGGHASVQMLTDVINAVNPTRAILPMHTEDETGFKELDIFEELQNRVII
jgi:ribonuclease J